MWRFSRGGAAAAQRSEYSEVTRNRRSVAGNQNLRREIFDIGCAAGFSSTVSLYRPLWRSHRPPAESLAGNPGIRRHNGFASCETNAVRALENCQRDPAFAGCGHKRIAGYIEARRDFLRCRPPGKCSPENRAFQRLPGSCRRHFGSVAGNPNRQPGIKKNRRKSAEGAELFCSCAEFQISSCTFEFSARDSKIRLTF
jgi:hypothetical protein